MVAKTFRMNSLGAALLMLALIIAGCSGHPLTTREQGTLAGGAVGAGAGAIIGATVGAPGAGAAIGGTLGGGAGFAVANAVQNEQIRIRRTQLQLSSQRRQIEKNHREIVRLESAREQSTHHNHKKIHSNSQKYKAADSRAGREYQL